MPAILKYWFEAPINIVFLIFLVGMYPLGVSGLWVRKGIYIKNYMKRLPKVTIMGKPATPKTGITVSYQILGKQVTIEQADNLANRYIWIPIIGWAIGYILVFAYCRPIESMFSLLGLIIPAFGYYGKFFWLKPSDD
jgi:hypothetical protein